MPQLTDYRTAVQVKGYDGLATATIDSAIQEARRRVMQDRRWSWQSATNTALVTVSGTDTVSLAAITDLMHIDSVRLSLAGVPVTPFEWKPLAEIEELQDQYADDTGTPRFWARRGTSLVLYPTPDAVYTARTRYVSYPGDLAAATNDVIPAQNQDLVVWAAVVPLAYRQREHQDASGADQYYSKVLLPRHAAQDATEQRQTPRQVRSGYWGVG